MSNEQLIENTRECDQRDIDHGQGEMGCNGDEEYVPNLFQEKLDRIEAEAEASSDWDAAVPQLQALCESYGIDINRVPCHEMLACVIRRASGDFEPLSDEALARLERETEGVLIEVEPALAARLDIREARAWINRRVQEYNTADVDWIRLIPAPSNHIGHCPHRERIRPRSRTFETGYRIDVYWADIDLPETRTMATGSENLGTATTWGFRYTHTEVTFADAAEVFVFRVGVICFRWLRRSGQIPVNTFGKDTGNSARKCGIAWLEDYRQRTRPNEGRRAAIMAQRARRAAEGGA